MIQRTTLAITVILAVLIGNAATADELLKDGADKPIGHYAEVNGIKMYYEIHGEGEPLVLVHGFLGSGAFWRSYIEDFAKHYKLIIPDLRCHGRSNSPTSEFTHRQAALDVYALLDLLKVKRFRAMGISSGGNVLLHMATQQPERVEAMVLVFATTYHPEQARETIRQFTFDKMPEQLRKDITEWHKGGDEQMQHLLAQFQKFADRYDDMNFTPPYLSTIKAKTFVVNGDRDEFIPLCIPLELYQNIPNSYLWIIPNGKHAVPEGATKLALIEKSLEFFQGEWESKDAPR
jgi:pimeloyl-ACP methyl ester carboxylesterase